MKRSSQVALLLMGVAGVGAGAYAMMPGTGRDCRPPASAVAPGAAVAPPIPGGVQPAAQQECKNRSWWPGSGGSSSSRTSTTGSSRSFFSGWGSSSGSSTRSTTSSSTSSSRSAIPSTSRGGFGSTGSSFSISS